MTKYHRDLTRKIEAAGVTVVGWNFNCKHAVCHFLDGSGAELKYYTGRTPSDHRVAIKVTKDIVRMAKAAKAKA